MHIERLVVRTKILQTLHRECSWDLHGESISLNVIR